MSVHPRGVNVTSKPSGTGCAECLASGGWWYHLRRCAECGHIGCCDSSPSQHGRRHADDRGHPVAASFEPGEIWFYDYETEQMLEGPPLPEPRWHPSHQSAPGPAGKVPPNWQSLLR